MKKLSIVFIFLFLTGCTSVPIDYAYGSVKDVTPFLGEYGSGFQVSFVGREIPFKCDRIYGPIPILGDSVQGFQVVAFDDYLGCYFKINED